MESFPDPEERLRAICENMLADKEGLFDFERVPGGESDGDD